MVKREDPELTSFHRHTKITIDRTTTYENDLKTNRRLFTTEKVEITKRGGGVEIEYRFTLSR